MSRVSVFLSEVEAHSTSALRAHGAEEFPAKEVAKAICVAEATGNVICGLYYLESYCQQLLTGRVNGSAQAVISQPKSGCVLSDAKFGFAQPAFAKGLDAAVEAASQNGIANFAVAHAHTCTSLGYFTEQIAKRGLLAVGFTNAYAKVAPPNGSKPVLGTNPMAMAVPDQKGGIAFQFDQSTTVVALGKITMAKAAGEKIPKGWALDADGVPTDDPAAALAGTLCSTGGYKGWGFGVMVEVMASALTGSVSSRDIEPLKQAEGRPHDLGQSYILIDPAVYSGQGFWDRIDALQAAVDEQGDARLPGSQPRWSDPVELDADLWDQVLNLSAYSGG